MKTKKIVYVACFSILFACAVHNKEVTTFKDVSITPKADVQPAQQLSSQAFSYPQTRKDSVVENFHGTQVPDPFRWLENGDSDETKQWVAAQNTITQKYISDVAQKENFRKRMTELWDFQKYQVPIKKGKYYFFLKNNGLQNQYVLYFQDMKEKEAKVLVDPNIIDPNGTTAITSFTVSEGAKYLA